MSKPDQTKRLHRWDQKKRICFHFLVLPEPLSGEQEEENVEENVVSDPQQEENPPGGPQRPPGGEPTRGGGAGGGLLGAYHSLLSAATCTHRGRPGGPLATLKSYNAHTCANFFLKQVMILHDLV